MLSDEKSEIMDFGKTRNKRLQNFSIISVEKAKFISIIDAI